MEAHYTKKIYLLNAILELSVRLNEVPIFGELFPDFDFNIATSEDENTEDSEYTIKPSKESTIMPVPHATKTTPDWKTMVTPTVLQVCKRLFPTSQHKRFELCDVLLREMPVPQYDDREEHLEAPRIKWQTESDVPGYYLTVLIDLTLYSVSLHSSLKPSGILKVHPGWRCCNCGKGSRRRFMQGQKFS